MNSKFTYRRSSPLLLSGLIFLCLSLKAQEPENYAASPNTQCSTREIRILKNAIQLSDGVIGFNPDNHHIDLYAARKGGALETFMGKNWYPLRPTKQILRGRLTKFEVYDGSGDEMDWNLYILPDEAYNDLILEAVPYKFEHVLEVTHLDFGTMNDAWHTITENGKKKIVMEAEITPDDHLYNLRWFPKNSTSPLQGRKVCVYGPFVREEAHGNRPEIHPCEQIWWRDGDGAYYLMLVLDDSNRFSHPQDFGFGEFMAGGQTINIPLPKNWQPWATEDGLTGSFKIAFEINPASDFQLFQIRMEEQREINRQKKHADSDNGTEHSIEFKGKKVLTVREPQDFDDRIGVTFENVCYNTGENKLQGYIVITGTVGNGKGKEGILFLRVDKTSGNVGDRLVKQWQYSPGLNNWHDLRADETQTPLQDMRFSNYNGEGYVHGTIDFDGDGISDVFKKRRDQWQISRKGTSDWETINSSNVSFQNMRFGDFNGDRKTDILGQVDNRWKISYSGTGHWEDINSSVHDFRKLRFGDFDGDGSADVFGCELGNYKFKVQYRATTNHWIELKAPYFPWGLTPAPGGRPSFAHIPVDQLRFGDFNGDGKTDVFAIYYESLTGSSKDTWWVSWGGKTDWEKLRKDDKKVPLAQLIFGNFDNDAKTDILYIDRTGWYYSYGGKTAWDKKASDEKDYLNVAFGNFIGGRAMEAFRMRDKSVNTVTAPPDQPATAVAKKKAAFKNNYVKGSLKRAKQGSKDVLTMDVELRTLENDAEENPGANVQKRRAVKMVKDAGTNREVPKDANDKINVDVSTARSGHYEVETDEGDKIGQEVVSFSPTSVLSGMKVVSSTPGLETAWNLVKRTAAAATAANNMKPPPKLELIKEVQVGFQLAYAPMRHNEPTPGEESPVTEEINEAILKQDKQKLNALFGTEKPFVFEWKFAAADVSSGARVPLVVNKNAGPNEIQVTIKDDAVGKNQLSLRFPSTDKIYLVLATAVTKDSYGKSGTKSFPIWSVYSAVSKSDLQKFLEMNAAGSTDFKTMASQFADDGRYSLEELAALMRSYAK